MDIKSTVFTQLRAALIAAPGLAKFTSANIAPIASVDIDYGQMVDPEKFEVYSTPAIFVKTSLQRIKKGEFAVSMQLSIAVDLPHYINTPEALTGQDVPLNIYAYQNVVREIVEDMGLGFEFTGDEEIDVENTQFMIVMRFDSILQEVNTHNLEIRAVDASLKILLSGVNVVKEIK